MLLHRRTLCVRHALVFLVSFVLSTASASLAIACHRAGKISTEPSPCSSAALLHQRSSPPPISVESLGTAHEAYPTAHGDSSAVISHSCGPQRPDDSNTATFPSPEAFFASPGSPSATSTRLLPSAASAHGSWSVLVTSGLRCCTTSLQHERSERY
ncbi:hypothetical protein PF005_g32712 [Phytophthora fragariae]|uniref:RxLR effector protein n=2 Tax=Phytophthora fragariae TaxID=53985 RepID=A0A6A3DKV7_9STRA|nr:hypothetical protein PF009_g30667 [Phytophthora fragariae]KAE8960923.1 hypothetical protein PF011_g29933 [Phytophthora fragariae]KAE9157762.1 hypothetical protein PF005_g32712 [Phytophthora fragariae]